VTRLPRERKGKQREGKQPSAPGSLRIC
jgi:hypothetical protein